MNSVVAHLAREGQAFTEADVISALQTFEDVWGQLFPAEQTRIVQLLVRRVTVTSEGLVIDVRTDGVLPKLARRNSTATIA